MDSNDIHQIKSVLSTMTTTSSFISWLTQQSIRNGEKLTRIMQIQGKNQITPSQKIVLIYTLGHSKQQTLCLHRNNIWKLKIKQQHSQTSLDKKIAFDFKIKSLQVKHRQSSQKLRNNKTCCHQKHSEWTEHHMWWNTNIIATATINKQTSKTRIIQSQLDFKIKSICSRSENKLHTLTHTITNKNHDTTLSQQSTRHTCTTTTTIKTSCNQIKW